MEEVTTAGVCYRVPKDKVEEVLDNLDFREKGGYTRAIVEVQRATSLAAGGRPGLLLLAQHLLPTRGWREHRRKGRTVSGTCRQTEPREAAAIIASAVGPSGPNIVYFDRLAEWLDSVGEVDPHIDTIRALIKEGQALRPQRVPTALFTTHASKKLQLARR
eukprot:2993021-Prymnesium_polylepis.2